MLAPESLNSIFDEDVPESVQSALVQGIESSYQTADEFCSNEFDSPEVRDVVPHVRRAYVETMLHQIPDQFGEVTAHTGCNNRGNSFRYIRCGRICLTASYVQENGLIPRTADFRNKFARDYNSPRLFPEDERERVETLAAITDIYAILTHRPLASDQTIPAHVSVTFVDENCCRIASIDLLARNTIQDVADVEVVRDEVPNELRKDAAQGSEGIA